MVKWTALLFPYDALGRRMKKGDIICIEPYGHPWSPKEVNNHEIVTLDGITEFETAGLVEGIFDLNSYEEYKPMTFAKFQERNPGLGISKQMEGFVDN